MPSIAEQAMEWLERVKGHQVTVVGENIIDEYIYVRSAGKSAKDSLVTFVRNGAKRWLGGAGIIAQHLDTLGCDVMFHSTTDRVLKTRYVDPVFNQKVFSVCDRDSLLRMDKWETVPNDIGHLIIADFGHHQWTLPAGLYQARFTSLMVQSNSLNWGFNLITKYACADYVVCDEAELRLACQDNRNSISDLAQRLARRMKVQLLAVTLGHHGAMLYVNDRPMEMEYAGVIHRFPTYARKVVDRMGAGDAFLAASAPLAAMGAPSEVVGLVGSVAAGSHVEKEGNPALCREELIERLKQIDVPQT